MTMLGILVVAYPVKSTANVEENSAAAMEERADSDGEDIVQDLILSSDESD